MRLYMPKIQAVKLLTLTYSYGWNGRYKQKFEITVKKHEVKAYYVQRPGMDPDSLENKDWKYVGYGNIDVSGIKNQHGTDMVGGEHYSLDNPAGRVINYPSDTNIKKIIADLYGSIMILMWKYHIHHKITWQYQWDGWMQIIIHMIKERQFTM